jgi:hypothetical protein
MHRVLLAFALVLLTSLAAWATSLRCSIDNSSLWFTGKTRTEMGMLLWQHKCASQHIYWLTQAQMGQ